MKTHLAGFLILTAAMHFTGCASHKPLAEKPVTQAAKPPLRPARPKLTPTQRDSIKTARAASLSAFRLAHPVKPRITPVVHDTIRDTVYIREIQHKHKRRPCKA